MARNVKYPESKNGPSLSQDWKYVAQHNWTNYWLRKWSILAFCFLTFFLQNLILFAEGRIVKEQQSKKGKTKENLDQFLTQKSQTLDLFWLYNIKQICPTKISINVYAVKLK